MNKELIEEIKNLKDKLTQIEIGSYAAKSDYRSMRIMLDTCFNIINYKLDYLFDRLEDLCMDLSGKENAEKSKRLKDEIKHKQDELNCMSNIEFLNRGREERYRYFHSKDYNRKE